MAIQNKIITFMNTREALGQMLIKISMAMACVNQLDDDISLVNLNAYSQPIFPFFFNIKPEKNIFNVLSVVERLDDKMLKGFFSQYSPNLYFLDVSDDTNLFQKYEDIKYQYFISLLKEAFKFSFITVERQINDKVISVLDMSDLLIIVVSPHLFSLQEAQFIIEKLKQLHYPLGFIKIISNMSGIKGGFKTSEIKDFLNVDVIGEIPVDSEVFLSAVNDGNLPLEKFTHSPFSIAIKKIANLLVKEVNKSKNEKSIFDAAPGKSKELKRRIQEQKTESEEVKPKKEISPEELAIALKKKIHKRILTEFDIGSFDSSMDEERMKEIKEKIKGIIESYIAEEDTKGLSREMRSKVVSELLDDILGLGPLEPLLRQEDVSEIMVNGPNDIYIERNGKIVLTDYHFTTEEQLRTVIDRILAPIGRRVDESSPLVDARLKDGSRVNIIISPLSLIGPVITIRKFVAQRLGIQDLIKLGSITKEIVDFLEICVKMRKNIIVSGGTGSGKTTLLNMLSSFIPSDERIVTIEDSAELKLRQRHVITLESKPPNIEGKGAIPIRRLVINALRMRPDRIVVGECRGGEALDMLQAMNTGHDGSLTTIHANTPKDAVSRLTTMVIMAGTELPQKAILEQIASAINVIVQTARLSDGSRKITKVTEVLGLDGDKVNMQDIFYFDQKGIDERKKIVGEFGSTGILPSFYNEIEIHGLKLPKGIFTKDFRHTVESEIGGGMG